MKYNTRNDLVPWPIVLIVLSAVVLVCSSCLTLLADLQDSTMISATNAPLMEETSEMVLEDITLPPRERAAWSSASADQTQRPIGFFDSVITRLKYN